jgi:hypothetical protein
MLAVGARGILTAGLRGLPHYFHTGVRIVPQIKRRPLPSAYILMHWPLNLIIIRR